MTLKNSTISTEDMALINRYTRRPFEPEEVYSFPVTLCDNEIDRDGEQFTTESLNVLSRLFVGKTGVMDHQATAGNQTARIYSTKVVTEFGRRTVNGDIYTKLTARAYMIRNDSTQGIIDRIDSGILKEVSVSCKVDKILCSICGADIRATGCIHKKGKTYNGHLCCHTLLEPQDAYEWSFVAVPSQREAGVTKSFEHGDILEKAKAALEMARRIDEEGGIIMEKWRTDEAGTLDEMKGVFFREEISKRNSAAHDKAQKALGAAVDSSGALRHGLLPQTLHEEIILVPPAHNPLRPHMTVSNKDALEVARLMCDLESFGFLEDGETARELELAGDLVKFERYKVKLIANVSETLLLGTDTELQQAIVQTLQKALTTKEKQLMLTTTPVSGQEHMSLYSAGIKHISGADARKAILNAYVDLEEAYKANAIALVNPLDWVQIVESSGSGGRAEDILGIPVVMCEMVGDPVVGDFSFAQINYSTGTFYESEKNVKTGWHTFTLTTWLDIQYLMKAAFRIAKAQ